MRPSGTGTSAMSPRRTRTAIALATAVAAVVGSACGGYTVGYGAAASPQLAPSVQRARLVEDVDVATLQRAGASVVGDLRIDSSGLNETELERLATEEAARRGGTHITIAAAGGAHGRGDVSVFVVWALPRDRWALLPTRLRP